jgi:hypothetical protein
MLNLQNFGNLRSRATSLPLEEALLCCFEVIGDLSGPTRPFVIMKPFIVNSAMFPLRDKSNKDSKVSRNFFDGLPLFSFLIGCLPQVKFAFHDENEWVELFSQFPGVCPTVVHEK